jgi:hypothetical protein
MFAEEISSTQIGNCLNEMREHYMEEFGHHVRYGDCELMGIPLERLAAGIHILGLIQRESRLAAQTSYKQLDSATRETLLDIFEKHGMLPSADSEISVSDAHKLIA